MFYRRKLLLSLLSESKGTLDKLRLQKLLFLTCQKQDKPSFHFVPYKYGCFSFQANADLNTMKKMGLVEECDKSWKIRSLSPGDDCITSQDYDALNSTLRDFAKLDTKAIIRYTYLQFPFFALNSQLASKLLTADEQKTVKSSVRRETEPMLLSIGYEGKSLEEFINILLNENIPLLCDVRKNALSMKYGFSKKTLSLACENVGIQYRHYPALGINSSDRTDLCSQKDYDALFLQYRKTILIQTIQEQKLLCADIKKAHRAAIMCFEAIPAMCHRTHLIGSLAQHFESPVAVRNS